MSKHKGKINFEIVPQVNGTDLVEDGDSRLTDARTPTAHDLAGAEHNADTLANLNSKVSDATLIDTGDSRLSDARAPTAHDLGGAEHNADTLANLNSKVSDATLIDTGDSRLSDARTPTAHASSHQNGGSDEIATATAAANAIPKAGGGGTLADGWIAASNVTQHEAALTVTESQISDLTHTDADAIHDNVAGEIAAVTEKVTPVGADLILIEDSADSNNKKRVQITNLPGGGGGSVEIDRQSVATAITTSTTSSTFTDLNLINLTTNNTVAKDYIISFSCVFDNSSTNKTIEFRIVVDGTPDATSVRTWDVKSAGSKATINTECRAPAIATGKIIKVQYRTTGGTLTAYERNLIIDGIS